MLASIVSHGNPASNDRARIRARASARVASAGAMPSSRFTNSGYTSSHIARVSRRNCSHSARRSSREKPANRSKVALYPAASFSCSVISRSRWKCSSRMGASSSATNWARAASRASRSARSVVLARSMDARWKGTAPPSPSGIRASLSHAISRSSSGASSREACDSACQSRSCRRLAVVLAVRCRGAGRRPPPAPATPRSSPHRSARRAAAVRPWASGPNARGSTRGRSPP